MKKDIWNFKRAEWIRGKISSFFSLPIWPFHPFSIGFDPPHNSISWIDPKGNEYTVQISYIYRLGLVFSFGVPHLHLYIYSFPIGYILEIELWGGSNPIEKGWKGQMGSEKKEDILPWIHSACHVWNFKCFLSSTWNVFFSSYFTLPSHFYWIWFS